MSRLTAAMDELGDALVEFIAGYDLLPAPWMGMDSSEFYDRFMSQGDGPEEGETVALACGQCGETFTLTRTSEYRGRGRGGNNYYFYRDRHEREMITFRFGDIRELSGEDEGEFGRYDFFDIGMVAYNFPKAKELWTDHWPICSPACAAVFAARLYAVDKLKREQFEEWKLAHSRIREARALLAGAQQLAAI